MFEGKTLGIVIPCYNEELLIGEVFDTMPDYVDAMYVINDCSADRTKEIILEYQQRDSRIVLIDHEINRGLGQSLIDGYLRAADDEVEVIAVMAGDAQMSPADLPAIVGPVARGEVDYTKGNRLLRDDVIGRMPTYRFYGNGVLTLLTKFATGYWHLIDPQSGYTAISLRALKAIPIQDMIKGYGYNAHILNMLNLANFSVRDIEIEPVYGREVSSIKLAQYVRSVSWLLSKLFFRRLTHKYLIREFHPLIFFYAFGGFNAIVTLGLLVRFLWLYASLGEAPQTTLILLASSANMAFLNLFFGMWMDMEDNRRLNGSSPGTRSK